MIKEIKTQQEIIEYYKYCDVCGTEINNSLSCFSARCMYCKKDLCEKCIGHEEETSEDYRDVWCKRCWDIGTFYRSTIEKLNKAIETLYNEWREKCKGKEE